MSAEILECRLPCGSSEGATYSTFPSMISYLVSGITRRSSTAGRDARRFVERRPGGSTRAFEDAGGDIGRSVSRGRDIIPRMAVRIPAILDGPPSMSDEAWEIGRA